MSCRSMTSVSMPVEHRRGRPARLAVERVDRQPGLLVRRRRHFRVEHAADAVLGAEERDQLDVLGLVQQVDAVAPSRARPVWLVTSPTRLPRSGANPFGAKHVEPGQDRRRRPRRPAAAADGAEVAPGPALPSRDSPAPARSPRPRPSRPARAAASRRPCRPDGRGSTGTRRTCRVAGSIHSDVPVKPVCPNEPSGSSSPRLRRETTNRCPSRGARTLRPRPASPAWSSSRPSSGEGSARRGTRRRRAACGRRSRDRRPC